MNPTLWAVVAIIAGLSIVATAAVVRSREANSRPRLACEETAGFIAAGWRPLVDCPRDCDVCLRRLQVDHCVVHRLLELGLTPGTELRVVQDAGGPMLLSVRGSRVALGRDLAEKLWVEIDLPTAAMDNRPIA